MATLVGPGLHPQYTSAFGEASGDPSKGLSDTKRTGSPLNIDSVLLARAIFHVEAQKIALAIKFHLLTNAVIFIVSVCNNH